MYSIEGSSGIFWFLVANTVWLAVLSFLVWQNNFFLKKLFPKGSGNFKEKLEQILGVIKEMEDLKKGSVRYFQKAALKRYNPYQDTGGDQSFSLAFLDGENNGLVVTSLHSRTGTRIFAKPIQNGKEGSFKFSDEETEVIKEALLS